MHFWAFCMEIILEIKGLNQQGAERFVPDTWGSPSYHSYGTTRKLKSFAESGTEWLAGRCLYWVREISLNVYRAKCCHDILVYKWCIIPPCVLNLGFTSWARAGDPTKENEYAVLGISLIVPISWGKGGWVSEHGSQSCRISFSITTQAG